MATFSSVTRQHILQAIAEHDARGATEFLQVYGFAPSVDHALVHEGRSYDSRAVLGVAHRYATGRLATPDDFHGGMQAAAAILRKRGFEVSEPPSAARGPAPRATRAPRGASSRAPSSRTASSPSASPRRSAGREAPVAICPTCSMTLPATGICDDCG